MLQKPKRLRMLASFGLDETGGQLNAVALAARTEFVHANPQGWRCPQPEAEPRAVGRNVAITTTVREPPREREAEREVRGRITRGIREKRLRELAIAWLTHPPTPSLQGGGVCLL